VWGVISRSSVVGSCEIEIGVGNEAEGIRETRVWNF
jgi:hypothetical protein